MALKSFNPTTPSQRQLVIVDRSELWKGKPVKTLTEGLNKTGDTDLVDHLGLLAFASTAHMNHPRPITFHQWQSGGKSSVITPNHNSQFAIFRASLTT